MITTDVAPSRCAACGVACRVDALFCTRCGRAVRAPGRHGAAAPPAAGVPAPRGRPTLAAPGPVAPALGPRALPGPRSSGPGASRSMSAAPTQVPRPRTPSSAPTPVPARVSGPPTPVPAPWSRAPVSPVAPRPLPWYSRPATAIVAAAVAVLSVGTAVVVVLDGGSSGSTPAPVVVQSASSGADRTTPAAVGATDPQAQLQALAASDQASVEGLVGSWVPQLSSKRPGLLADGQTYDAASILAENQALRSAHPEVRLLWSGDFANYRGRNFWVSVVGQPAPTAAAANAWCDAQGFDADHCYAVRLTHSGGPEGNSVMRTHH